MKITILFFFLFQVAHAQTCRPVDYRAALGDARDQGPSGWCFAHTSADLITQKIGVRVSAFDIATTFLLYDTRNLAHSHDRLVREYLRLHPEFSTRVRHERLDRFAYSTSRILGPHGLLDVGGLEDLAIVLASGQGLCLDKNLPSESTNNSYLQNLNAIEKYYKGLSAAQKHELKREYAYLNHIRSPASVVVAGAFQSWVNQQCGPRLPAHELSPQQYYIARDADDLDTLPDHVSVRRQRNLHRLLDDVLDQGRAVAIGYDANDVMTRDPDDLALHADHSSVIAARRHTPRGCEYFVRNSFGPGCDDFRADMQRVCEQGGVWVTLDQLPSLYSAVWID